MPNDHPPSPAIGRNFLKPVILFLGVAFVLALSIIIWAALSSRVPSYQGKSADQWLMDALSTNHAAAMHAFQEMEPKSVPFLVHAISSKESLQQKLYNKIYPALPKPLQKRFPSPIPVFSLPEIWSAAQAALTHLTNSRSALPELVQMLEDKHVASHAQISGVIIALVGPTDTNCASGLARCLKDPNPDTRQAVATALIKIGPAAKAVVPQLTSALNDPNPNAQIQIAWALWKIDHQTNACANALIAALKTGPMHYMQDVAMNYLSQIGSRDAALLPAYIELLRRQDIDLTKRVVHELSLYGPDAREAVPALVQCLESSDPELKQAALMALKNIDPVTAAKHEQP